MSLTRVILTFLNVNISSYASVTNTNIFTPSYDLIYSVFNVCFNSSSNPSVQVGVNDLIKKERRPSALFLVNFNIFTVFTSCDEAVSLS